MDDAGEAVRRADGGLTDRATADGVLSCRAMADGGRTGDGQVDGAEEHVCEACGRTFPTEAALEDHVQEQGIVD